MRQPPLRRISCDASVRDGNAGVAAVLEGRDVRVLFLDVAVVENSSDGERMALEKAMAIARRAGWTRAIFRTDCKGLKPKCELLEGWTIERVPRGWNIAAHTCATQALKLWEAGCGGRPTIESATDRSGSDIVLTTA